ncbi:hypothetical protein PR048_014960 [Dryococelus australis]|uniref:Uncharacterized protein n=1 Tax=Dryococelus australis TaxID=614101 RepID=A0ABQ9HFV0_9NEOP|nr:hypothetical protein PR048_014960 [Dryococelus australis]
MWITTASNLVESWCTMPQFLSQYQETVALILDWPTSTMEMAVFWVENVSRHRGAPHMTSVAVDMPLHQDLLPDVISVL